MMQTEIENELMSAMARVEQVHLDWMQALNVPSAAIAALGATQVPFGVANVQADRSHLYQPGDGALHVIMPVMEEGALIDLIAWRGRAPARWHWRLGSAWALGTDWLGPQWGYSPTRLHATPLDWLASGGEGMCILDWGAPEVRQMASLEAIDADEMIGRKLLAILSKPVRLPRMIYRKAVRNAAA